MLQRNQKPVQRKKPIKRKRAKPRRGRVVDKKFLAFIASEPCIISGKRATVHHVREFGSPKDDRRTLPLALEYHLIQFGPDTSIEGLGKAKFEALHGVDLEASILHYNQKYERLKK